MVDYVKRLSRAAVREEAPRRQGRARSAPGRAMAARRRSTRSSTRRESRERRRVGLRRGRRAPEDGGPDGAASRLLAKYRDKIETGKLVTRETAANALGADVSRLRHADVPQPDRARLQPGPRERAAPESYDELVDWVKENPKKFGYNGIKGGMSGVAFVVGWVSAFGGDADKLMKGPYDGATKAAWDKLLGDLKEFNKSVVITPGQCRHARHAQPRRDRDGAGVGRHVLHLDGGRQAAAEHEAEADRARHAGPADVLRDAREGGERRSSPRSSSRWRRARRCRPKAS